MKPDSEDNAKSPSPSIQEVRNNPFAWSQSIPAGTMEAGE
jgi:hypothetical protein